MRVAAIDLGTVRVGVALSDELGLMAHPRPHLSGADRVRLLRELAALASAERLERFVVGLPRQLDGSEGRAAREARRFAKQLADSTGVPVSLCDEWLTTREGQQRLRAGGHTARQSRGRIDSAAAAILLQSWLDRQSRGSGA